MAVKWKFYQIVSAAVIADIMAIRQEKQKRQDAIIELVKKFGAEEAKVYSGQRLACFVFPRDHEIDRDVWKKADGGWLPKVKTKNGELIKTLPPAREFNDVLGQFGLGGEMVIGQPAAGQRGFPMYKSQLQGSFKNQFFYVKTPYQGEYKKSTPDGLKEIKEWEALKGEDDGE